VHGRPVVYRNGKPVVDFGITAVPVVFENGKPIAYGDVKGDAFTFDVYRSTRGTPGFRAEKPAPLAEPVAETSPTARTPGACRRG